MNKKFTFMVAALLAAGSSFAETVNLGNKPEAAGSASNKYYYVVCDNDAKLDATNSFALGANASGLKGIGYVEGGTNAFQYDDASETDKNYLWKVTSKLDTDGKTWLYSFYNVATEKYLSATKADGSTPVLKAESELTSTDNIWFNWEDGGNSTGVYNGGKFSLILGGSNELKISKSGDISVSSADISGDTNSNVNIYLFEVKESVLGATDAVKLNETIAGEGFSLAPDGTEVEDENNIFSKQVKAFYVEAAISSGGTSIPAGMYFATEWPESLNGVQTGDKNVIATVDEFDKCKFVAVSPNLISGTSYGTAGLKLVEISGADLKRYEQTKDDQTTDEEVWVNNACFTVVEKDKVNNPGKYTLSLAKIRYQSKADGTHEESKEAVYIGLNSDKVVTTVAAASAKEFKCVNSTVVNPLTLVADTKTPTIYNIQFVSGDGSDSEKGKYLGVGVTNSNLDFVAQGEALVDLESPQYRFVVSQVKDNVITFKNLETGKLLVTELYKTADGNYRLNPETATEKVQVAKSTVASKDSYTETTLKGLHIKLDKVEANTEAGFLVKAPNNNEPFKFMFATAENADDKYYLVDAGSQATKLEKNKPAEALQFVFEPVSGADGLVTIKSDYIYKEDGNRRLGDNATMMTAQKYVLRVVENSAERYAKVTSNALKLDGTKSDNTKFVVKVNYDGSVSLIDASASSLTEFTNSVKEFAVNDATTPASITNSSVSIYDVPNSEATSKVASSYSMYLVAENLGLSLEAESKHISLEAENGGFIKVAENGNAIIDNLATSTTEDLTFWLDTTNSKSVLPVFYISKAGKFLFNPADSARVWDDTKGANPYEISDNINKVIFKAATLVDSETLKTTVNNKEVTLGASSNQNEGVVAGISQFQFNIVKADDAEDNYVLRSVGGSNYVASYSNVLGLTGDINIATRVIVADAQAPTSNESVSASEVKVVANNGSIVVKNAAGKNVVVSTILGQVVANEVLTSDNATINVPAGIVVVAVEGESFKVNVK